MIEILLPVYNGEKYLSEQIDSILGQTYQDWILKIRNDGSKDNSQDIIEFYCNEYPDKIKQIKYPTENVGLVKSLNYLAEAEPHGDYVAFSDQDDVWLPDKLSISMEEIKNLEKIHTDSPIGICTDAVCVNSNLKILSNSFFYSQKFPNDTIGDVNKMLALNVVQGSTVVTNRKASELYFPIPDFLNVHDMWLSIIISNYGHMEYIRKQTILYRQHDNNVLGQINIGLKYYLKRAKSAFNTLGLIRKIQKALGFKSNLILILLYKFRFAFNRIF